MGVVSRAACRFFCAGMLSVNAMENAEPFGLVLSGGGAKGAYEIGVWQELQAAGVASKVTAISGTSVGAINAALFATRPDAVAQLWLEKMDDVFTINTNRVGESIQKTLDDLSNAVDVAEKTGENWKGGAAFLFSSLVRVADNYVKTVESPEMTVGYVDSSKLAVALDEVLPKAWPTSAPVVYVTAVEKGGVKAAKTWCLNPEPHERRSLMIRASAAFPYAFDTVSIDGKVYVDGGWEWKGGDNVPLKPILEHHPEIKTVLIIHLVDKKHIDANRRAENDRAARRKGIQIVEIAPSKDIDGFLKLGTFNIFKAQELIALGRKDARNVLAKAGFVQDGQ